MGQLLAYADAADKRLEQMAASLAPAQTASRGQISQAPTAEKQPAPTMKQCHYCGRESTEDAAQCQECGTWFGSLPGETPTPTAPRPAIVVGRSGNLYGVHLSTGGATREVQSDREERGHDMLDRAIALETAGRVREALEAYQWIIANLPGTEAARDAQKSIDSLQAML